jgi:hypothetical protein
MAVKSNVNSKTFEIVIIVILIVLIVYMLVKLNNEHLENTQAETQAETHAQLQVEEKKVRFDLPSLSMGDSTVTRVETKSETVPSETESKSNEIVGADDDNSSNLRDVNNFLDEYVNYSRFTNKPPELISSQEDINSYRKSYLDFNNMINRTSSGFDAVDRMNEHTMAKAEASGMTVSEVYDRISGSNFDTSNIDLVSMQHVAKKESKKNKYLDINKIQYKDDTVNNGGFFFENVEGSENLNDTYMTL